QLAKEFYKAWGKVQLVNIYGSTEVGADATYYNVDRYYVEDILRYFTKQENILNQTEKNNFNSSITKPDVDIAHLTKKFQTSQIPEYPSSTEEYYSNFEKNILPYSINTASPKFIGHMTSVLPDYVHDMSKLISQLNQNLVKIETSKSLTFMEREAIAMLHQLFYSFPENFYQEHIQKLNSNLGIITSGGSTANISALLNARNKLLFEKNNINESIYHILNSKGYDDLVILGTSLLHYSFDKASSLLGFGTKNIIHVNDTPEGVIDLDDLQDKIDFCKEQKLLIVALIGIAGATETGRIDPLREMGEIAKKNNIHFHVDAAWGGLLKFSDKYAPLIRGIELADTITFCGHKQLFLPQGISVCLFKNPYHLNYNSTLARYQATANSFDFGRYTPDGSRSALSLCLHGALNIFGKKGYGLLLEKGIGLANMLAEIIRRTKGLELISININILNYRYIPIKYRCTEAYEEKEVLEINEVNSRIQQKQFFRGKTFVSKTTVKHNNVDIVVFRTVLSNPLTTKSDLESVILDQFEIIEELFDEENKLPLEVDKNVDLESFEKDGFSELETKIIPIGKPISNTEILILNRYGELQVRGFIGEIIINGDGLASGYTNTKYKTSSLNYVSIAGKLFRRTGDLGRYLPDGNIEFCGRLDRQVKLRGHRIELGEIEACINEYELVGLSAVVISAINSSKKLVAFYQARQELNVAELIEFLMKKLPIHMVPVDFIWLESIPIMSNGKIDRKLLPNHVLNARTNFVSPTTETEKKLQEIWSNILSLDKNTFGIHSIFFSLGGHSLNTIVLSNEIWKIFKVRISLKEIFRKNTISGQAKYIEANLWAQSGPDYSGITKNKVVI
ncbi:aminotransferase class V-fold PLP-dependent enzyme, partial [Maribacter sp. 2307UL18-2]|uniref:aminotransferase class V-fold PLP-dependent enzyme n=1 Tax=Maribacter sp. 2307UL18-2 TaxID=3386274 RepID=UPI0039BD05C3